MEAKQSQVVERLGEGGGASGVELIGVCWCCCCCRSVLHGGVMAPGKVPIMSSEMSKKVSSGSALGR